MFFILFGLMTEIESLQYKKKFSKSSKKEAGGVEKNMYFVIWPKLKWVAEIITILDSKSATF